MFETKSKKKEYRDEEYVEGVFRRDPVMEYALHNHCRKYFDSNYRGVFFVGDEHKDEIFQEAFITLWEKIMSKKIYVEDSVLRGKGGEAFSGKLTTYFMSIARLKFLEISRTNPSTDSMDDLFDKKQLELIREILYDPDDKDMIDIIADCLSKMSQQCNQIITMFYYEEKTLDDILLDLPTFVSKDALKTRKYKCMEELRNSAKAIYHRILNA